MAELLSDPTMILEAWVAQGYSPVSQGEAPLLGKASEVSRQEVQAQLFGQPVLPEQVTIVYVPEQPFENIRQLQGAAA